MITPAPTVESLLAKMAVVGGGDDQRVLLFLSQNRLHDAHAMIEQIRSSDGARAAYLDGFLAVTRGDVMAAANCFRDYHARNIYDKIPIYNFGWTAENIFYLTQKPDVLTAALSAYLMAMRLDSGFMLATEALQRLYKLLPSDIRPRLWSGDVAIELPDGVLTEAARQAGVKADDVITDVRLRNEHWDIVLPLTWIPEHAAKECRILSVGCGFGFDLLWLHRQGYGALSGLDKRSGHVQAATALARHCSATITYWQDTILHPTHLSPAPYDCIIALGNAIGAKLDDYAAFFMHYTNSIGLGGFLLFDAHDEGVPEQIIFEKMSSHGFELINLFREPGAVAKSVYALQRIRQSS